MTKVYFWGGMAAKYAMACFAANENDDENDNFHMEVNCQFSIVHCQLSKFVPTPTRYESVGCDDGRFISPKYRIDAPQNECEITKKEVSLLALSK